MALGQMRQTVTNDPTVTQLQGAINEQFSSLAAVPILNGQKLGAVALMANQSNAVPHKLGRMAQGYFVTSISSGALIWNDGFTDKVLPLHCSANCTVDIWVY